MISIDASLSQSANLNIMQLAASEGGYARDFLVDV